MHDERSLNETDKQFKTYHAQSNVGCESIGMCCLIR